MAERTINVGGRDIRLRASALLPRLYRFKFGRDIVADMAALKKAYDKASAAADRAKQAGLSAEEQEAAEQEAQLSVVDLLLFENLAWLMAKQADKSIPDEPDEWLDSLDGVFSIYENLPVILELWQLNGATTSVPAKN